jgi:hypothetical protein
MYHRSLIAILFALAAAALTSVQAQQTFNGNSTFNGNVRIKGAVTGSNAGGGGPSATARQMIDLSFKRRLTRPVPTYCLILRARLPGSGALFSSRRATISSKVNLYGIGQAQRPRTFTATSSYVVPEMLVGGEHQAKDRRPWWLVLPFRMCPSLTLALTQRVGLSVFA